MKGKIVKGIAGFYYVHVVESGVYECKAKGIFRKEKIKPLVGDNVEIDVINESEKTGNITEILPRKNELIRPAVAIRGDKPQTPSESAGQVSDYDGEQIHSGDALL